MGFKDFLGDISPVYGAMSGRGVTGRMLNPQEAARIAQEQQAQQMAADEQANREKQNAIAASYSGYKKGGKVSSASKRADGCAMRGKTKGKMY